MRKMKGLTLIEAILIVVILGVLAAVVVPKYISVKELAVDKAKNSVTHAVRNSLIIASIKHAYPTITDLVDYIAGKNHVRAVGSGVLVTIDNKNFIVQTYKDTECKDPTTEVNNTVKCIGSIVNIELINDHGVLSIIKPGLGYRFPNGLPGGPPGDPPGGPPGGPPGDHPGPTNNNGVPSPQGDDQQQGPPDDSYPVAVLVAPQEDHPDQVDDIDIQGHQDHANQGDNLGGGNQTIVHPVYGPEPASLAILFGYVAPKVGMFPNMGTISEVPKFEVVDGATGKPGIAGKLAVGAGGITAVGAAVLYWFTSNVDQAAAVATDVVVHRVMPWTALGISKALWEITVGYGWQ